MPSPPSAGSLPIREIVIGDRRRSLDAVKVCELAQSIAEIGLLCPVSVTESRVLIAGRHRLEACSQLGWTTVPVTVLPLSGLSAELAEIDENLIRNELQVLDRADHLARRKEIYEALHPLSRAGAAGAQVSNRTRHGHDATSEIISFAADTANKTGVTARTVQQEVQISEKIAPDVKDAIREMPVADSKTDLLLLARKPVDEQRQIVERIQSGAAADVKSAVQVQRRLERVERIQGISEGNKPLEGIGTFPVILADPPWRYDFTRDEADAIEEHYPTLGVEEICDLPVVDLATPDSVLFLWATSPKLAEAMQVMAAWGFAYVTCMVWGKDRIGCGYYARQKHELLLIGKRGELPVPLPANRPDSLVNAPVGKHSQKPVEFYSIIERMYPEYRRVELFCRSPREGWSAWGNQA